MPDKGNFAAVVQAYRWQNQKDGLVADDVVGLRASTGSSGFHEMNHPVVAVCGDTTHALTSEGADASEDGTGRGTPVVAHAIAFNWQNGGGYGNANEGLGITEEGTGPLQRCQTLAVAVATSMVVRRLTPVECERLQGFPDGWTDVGTPERPTADSHRYKQLGNAVTVNVAEWLARRIATVLKSQQ